MTFNFGAHPPEQALSCGILSLFCWALFLQRARYQFARLVRPAWLRSFLQVDPGVCCIEDHGMLCMKTVHEWKVLSSGAALHQAICESLALFSGKSPCLRASSCSAWHWACSKASSQGTLRDITILGQTKARPVTQQEYLLHTSATQESSLIIITGCLANFLTRQRAAEKAFHWSIDNVAAVQGSEQASCACRSRICICAAIVTGYRGGTASVGSCQREAACQSNQRIAWA